MLHTLFNIMPAVRVIFKLGFEPKEEYFYELTCEQYEQLENEGHDISDTWYLILPAEYKHQTHEALIVTEEERHSLIEAAKIVESYCDKSEKTFKTYEEKLSHVAALLPPVFTKDTGYEGKYLKLFPKDL